MFKRVLVPLDGSETAAIALPYLRDLAKEGSVGEVTFLSVVGVAALWDAASVTVMDSYYATFIEDELGKAAEYLADLRNQFESEGLTSKTEVLEGANVSQIIVDYAEKQDFDLILMGTHGRSGIKKLMLGSVALRVIQKSPCPVLLIKPEPSDDKSTERD